MVNVFDDGRLTVGAFLLTALLAGCAGSYPELDTLQQCQQPEPGEPAVKLTWLGVAGVFIDDGEAGLLIDPFVSRGVAGLSRVAGGRILKPELGKIRDKAKELGPTVVKGILVTHSHYDHVMDVPDFWRETKATVYGSTTTEYIMRAHGVPEKNGFGESTVSVVTPGTPIRIDPYTVEFELAAHAGHLGKFVLWSDTIKDREPQPTYPGPASAYPMGEVYRLKITHELGTILYYGSAGWMKPKPDAGTNTGTGTGADNTKNATVKNLKDEKKENAHAIQGDVVSIMALGGTFDGPGYVNEAVIKPDSDAVVPIHFDHLFELPQKPERLWDRSSLRDFVQVLTEKAPRVDFLPVPRNRACAVLPLKKT